MQVTVGNQINFIRMQGFLFCIQPLPVAYFILPTS